MSSRCRTLFAGIASIVLSAAAAGPLYAADKIAPAAALEAKEKGQVRVIIAMRPAAGVEGGGPSLNRPVDYVQALLNRMCGPLAICLRSAR
jgi:hypothetical protein